MWFWAYSGVWQGHEEKVMQENYRKSYKEALMKVKCCKRNRK